LTFVATVTFQGDCPPLSVTGPYQASWNCTRSSIAESGDAHDACQSESVRRSGSGVGLVVGILQESRNLVSRSLGRRLFHECKPLVRDHGSYAQPLLTNERLEEDMFESLVKSFVDSPCRRVHPIPRISGPSSLRVPAC